jgi:hypothetical protein
VGVSDRHGVAVPLHVFAVGFGSATVLALILSNGKPLVGGEGSMGKGDTRVVLADGADHPGGSDDAIHVAARIPPLVEGCSLIAANSEGAENVVIRCLATGWVLRGHSLP